jgi:hypothetical protein
MLTEFVKQPEGKRRLDGPKRRSEDNVQVIIGRIEGEGVSWIICLAQVKVKW